MMLLIDLDNTLVDRKGPFGQWAAGFVKEHGGSGQDEQWLVEADRDGYEPRRDLAGCVKQRLDLDLGEEQLVQKLLFEHVELMRLDPCIARHLCTARSLGWRIGVVTNGTTAQQSFKIDRLGLGALVDAVVISESEGVKKPDIQIFARAVERLGGVAGPAWMVGDNPEADICGGRAAGLQTGWVSRGASWPQRYAAPTLQAETTAQVLKAILDC